MRELFLVIGIVFALSCLPVLVNFLRARRRFSGTLIVTCPETDRAATIRLNAVHAAATSLTGEPDIKVKSCNRWSGPVGQCQERCLGESGALLLDHAKSA
ncbi:MAG TPA: hypothetical protein VLU06_01365 [Thermoanaerobaculia bacterium]|nr:hypothetical protein [Thermoanaerobaculia bacterium]